MYDLAIVGGGPAGASAAIFAARAGLRTVVLDADKGMTRRAMVNNLLGFVEGIPGPELVERGQQQATRAGAEWVTADVAALERRGEGFVLRTEDGRDVEAEHVLLTIGANVDLAHRAGLQTRPATEPEFGFTRFGWMVPVTAYPNFISSSAMLCPPRTAHPASRIFSWPPFRICDRSSRSPLPG